jgi:hypothetical protein
LSIANSRKILSIPTIPKNSKLTFLDLRSDYLTFTTLPKLDIEDLKVVLIVDSTRNVPPMKHYFMKTHGRFTTNTADFFNGMENTETLVVERGIICEGANTLKNLVHLRNLKELELYAEAPPLHYYFIKTKFEETFIGTNFLTSMILEYIDFVLSDPATYVFSQLKVLKLHSCAIGNSLLFCINHCMNNLETLEICGTNNYSEKETYGIVHHGLLFAKIDIPGQIHPFNFCCKRLETLEWFCVSTWNALKKHVI